MTIATTENRLIMERARASLRGKWGTAALVFLISSGLPFLLMRLVELAVGEGGPAGGVIPILVYPLFLVGVGAFYLAVARGSSPSFTLVFEGFPRYLTALAALLLVLLLVFLWALLLLVPGIVAAFSYSQTFFVLADDPSAGAMEAMRRSRQMMRGNKAKLFRLYFRFLGWALLGLLTAGIAFLWISPYFQTSLAHFYEEIKGEALADPAAA